MVGVQVLLRVSPMKSVPRFEKKGKLILRYIDPFDILKHLGEVAYALYLPLRLNCSPNFSCLDIEIALF